MTSYRRSTLLVFVGIFAAVAALRLCHSGVLWVDQDYHMAAGIQTLHGKLLYRDLWYDKPPLSAWLYAALGGVWGWPLRLFDAVYVTAICAAACAVARELRGPRVGLLAAALMAFFLSFGPAAAVIPLAPDLLMILPHLIAIWCALRGRAFPSGLICAVAFLLNTKGLFVLAVCGLLLYRNLPALAAGFLLPNLVVWAGLAFYGALGDYWRQVWVWGSAYAADSGLEHPWLNALRRTVNWMGFQSALVIGAAWLWSRDRSRDALWLACWTIVSLAGLALGARFNPRYFFQLLPPLVISASLGISLIGSHKRRWIRRAGIAALGFALLVPFVRFGPRYAMIGADLLAGRPHRWTDLVLDQDSQAIAALLQGRAKDHETLLVWGYRPDIFVYTRMQAGSRFWDSQPLTGVPADRHLTDARPLLAREAAANRRELLRSEPSFIVDSLSLSNPRLSLNAYPELRAWFTHYRPVARTPLSIIYQRTTAP